MIRDVISNNKSEGGYIEKISIHLEWASRPEWASQPETGQADRYEYLRRQRAVETACEAVHHIISEASNGTGIESDYLLSAVLMGLVETVCMISLEKLDLERSPKWPAGWPRKPTNPASGSAPDPAPPAPPTPRAKS